MTTNKSYTMIVDTVHGGIGHKAISLYYTITYSAGTCEVKLPTRLHS